MHDNHTRMMGLHHLLTGGPDRLARPEDVPRFLWGDLGLPEGRPHVRRRSLLACLKWGTGL